MRPRPERNAETANAVGTSASATTASTAVAVCTGAPPCTEWAIANAPAAPVATSGGERERVDPLAQRARGQHVRRVDAGRGEREQRAREVDRPEAAARDEQADAGDGEAERGGAAAREALAAEHDRARHHEHRVAVRDDAGRAGAHPLDRRQVGRRGRGVGRRAERDGDQRRCAGSEASAAGPAAPPTARRRRARSGWRAAWSSRRAHSGRARRGLRPNRTPRPSLRTPRGRGVRWSPPARLSVRAQRLVRAVGTAEQKEQRDKGVRHGRFLGKWLRFAGEETLAWVRHLPHNLRIRPS